MFRLKIMTVDEALWTMKFAFILVARFDWLVRIFEIPHRLNMATWLYILYALTMGQAPRYPYLLSYHIIMGFYMFSLSTR